jgi:hypothetical protein
MILDGSSSTKPLLRFLQLLCIFWLIAFTMGLIGKYLLHEPQRYWYPLFPTDARFTDFTVFQSRFSHFHQHDFFELAGFPFTYPAPAALAFEGFYLFGSSALGVYVGFTVAAFAAAGVFLWRAMRARGAGMLHASVLVGVTLVLSYPLWFLLDRANIETVNWLMVALGVAAYWKKKWYLAATLFGIAISLKIFPVVFLGLLFSARRYRALSWAVIVCAISTVASTWILGPTYSIASAGIARGLDFFRTTYALQVHASEIGFDHSLFAIVKEVIFRHRAQGSYYLPWLNGYMCLVAAAGCILFFWKIRLLPRANQILALTVVSILLPPVSADYTLVHLYTPWAVLVLIAVSRQAYQQRVAGLVFCLGCMALLMAPESYIFVDGIRVAGQLKAVVLCLLLINSLSFPFADPAVPGELLIAAAM